MAKVTIVTPAYNTEKYIAETIESVIKQTYEDWEWFIIIDGATDRTEEIVRTYLSDPRIKCISKENTGVSDTRNVGIKSATGDYIAFLDSDDVWLPENLAVKIKFLEEHQEYDWVFCDVILSDGEMNELSISDIGKDDNILDDMLQCRKEVVPGVASNIIIRKKCADKGVLYDEQLSTAADQDFCIQLVSNGFQGKHIKQALWKYRILGNSMSRNVAVMESDFLYLFKKAERNKIFKSWLFKQNCFSNLYLILAANWWKNGGSKINGIKYLIKSLVAFPFNVTKILAKL